MGILHRWVGTKDGHVHYVATDPHKVMEVVGHGKIAHVAQQSIDDCTCFEIIDLDLPGGVDVGGVHWERPH